MDQGELLFFSFKILNQFFRIMPGLNVAHSHPWMIPGSFLMVQAGGCVFY